MLENTLNDLPLRTRHELISGSKQPKINPQDHWRSMPYLKEDLVPKIMNYFLKKGVNLGSDFGDKVYNSINKEPLKRVYYGMKTEDNNGIMINRDFPKEVLEAVANEGEWGRWADLYAFAGIWNSNTANFEKSNYGIMRDLVTAGISEMFKVHNAFVKKEKYKNEMSLPFAKKIYDNMPKEKEKQIIILNSKKEKRNEDGGQLSLFSDSLVNLKGDGF